MICKLSLAIVAALESRIKIACNTPNLNIDLSEAHIFYCGCGNCNNTGWSIPLALDFCKNIGVCSESSFPWVPAYQPCRPGLVPYIKIKSWSQVLTVADRRNILATKGPMVAIMAVYTDFFNYSTGVYRHTTGSFSGYSSKTVVGYDDSQQCWICKNSWGTGWGENGWFKIGYGECLIDTSFAFYDIDLDCPVPPTPPCDLVYLRKVLELSNRNKTLKLALCYYICRRGRPVLLPTPTIHIIVLNVRKILAKCPQYRVPFCRLLGCTP